MPLEDEGVRLVRELGDERKIVSPEAIGITPLFLVVLIATRERHVVESSSLGAFIFPHGRFDATEAERFDGSLRRSVSCWWF